MKNNFLYLFLMFFFSATLFAQTPSSQLSYDKRIHDFGEIQEKDGKVSHTFIFTNTSKVPVVIGGTHSGCGCTSTDYTKEPIKPGSTGKVTVTYNPANRPGFFSKEIVVFSNNAKNYTRIWVKGTVVPSLRPVEEDHPYNLGSGLHSSLKVLTFGSVKRGENKEIGMFYANDTEKEMNLTFIVEGNHPNITFTNPGKLASKGRGKINFKYTSSSKKQGRLTFNIYPYVNGKKTSTPIIVKITEISD